MNAKEVAQNVRHAAMIIELYGLGRGELISVSCDAFDGPDIHISPEKFLNIINEGEVISRRPTVTGEHVYGKHRGCRFIAIADSDDPLFLRNKEPTEATKE